jgi:thiamine biosynthesis lipoprotein
MADSRSVWRPAATNKAGRAILKYRRLRVPERLRERYRMNRRDFLDPRRIARTAAPLCDALNTDAQSTDAGPVHLRFARRAMATTFEVILPFATPDAHLLAMDALDEIDRLEEQLSVYRDSSEVSRLNARAARHPVPVEPGLFELLALAKRLHEETGGAHDVAVGALIKAWGFYRRQGCVPSEPERAAVRERAGMQHVRLDPQRQTVAYDRVGLELNLGSIGKGYALDRAAALVGARDVLVHGGHSSVLARGSEAPGRDGWAVGLLDPHRPGSRRAVLRLRNRGLGTSAITHQHFVHEGKQLGHLLDPRTGWPASGVDSATATAPTAAEADSLATAFFILGTAGTEAYCATHPEIGAVLITADSPGRLLVLGRAVGELESTGRED